MQTMIIGVISNWKQKMECKKFKTYAENMVGLSINGNKSKAIDDNEKRRN